MMTCWSPDPNQRPSFREIVRLLSGYTETLAGYLDMTSNPFVSSFNQDLQRESRPNKLSALYYNVASKFRGRSVSPKVKSPKSSPRLSPHPDLACSEDYDMLATSPVRITIDSPPDTWKKSPNNVHSVKWCFFFLMFAQDTFFFPREYICFVSLAHCHFYFYGNIFQNYYNYIRSITWLGT